MRPAALADTPFLRRLYAETRAPELIATRWPAAEKAAFCDSQFALQHSDYVRRFPRSDFWVVTQATAVSIGDVGRLSLDRKSRAWRVIDIIVALDARGQGLGTALIEWVQASALAAGAQSVALTVATTNPGAMALYGRLGFVETGAVTPLHRAMEWRP
ncbi:MAG: GNAT family N-acetyltransferase [Sphingomonadales bacterium]|nr:MAG: GNAT family N-acetyltransferase [Sphingomonadales bacterium]